jgi:holliday junction DNA helicase RuvA
VIAYLRGLLLSSSPSGEVVVDVGGVGYRLSMTHKGAASLGPIGTEVRIFVHTHVREDAIVLFGFADDDERGVFVDLLGTHGVGPSLALNIVGTLAADGLRFAVASEDIDALCRVPGVGRKTAARLILDLAGRLDLTLRSPGVADAASKARAEARAALVELGYGTEEIRGALDGVADDLGVEEMLRLALKELATR